LPETVRKEGGRDGRRYNRTDPKAAYDGEGTVGRIEETGGEAWRGGSGVLECEGADVAQERARLAMKRC